MSKIVIIEDEKSIRDELCLLLANAGYEAAVTEDFSDTASWVLAQSPDLILLDVGLPGQDGYALCSTIRRVSEVPILFVTSRDTSMDELKALSLGGDDFIVKPYNIPVLLARIQAILRRGGTAAGEALTVNGLSLYLSRSSIQHGDAAMDVTKNESRILWCLMQRPGEIVSRADMIEFLWDNQVYIDDNTLSVNMTRLRTKLRELGLENYIRTKRGMGYKI